MNEDDQLNRFADGPLARDRLAALKARFTLNIPQKRPDDPRFSAGTNALLSAAAGGGERLEAVSALGRLLRGVRTAQPELISRLAICFSNPIPAMDGWADAVDRRFVAQAVVATEPTWALEYGLSFLVKDDASPRAREIFAAYALKTNSSFEATLYELAQAAPKVQTSDFVF